MASEDLTGLANELNDFFTSVGSITAQKARDLSLHHELNVNLDVPSSLHVFTNVSPELFVLHQVTENQVEKVIRRLPSNKAPGMDKISSGILKDSLPSTLTTITRIVNNSVVTNVLHVHGKQQKLHLFLNAVTQMSLTTIALSHYCQ